MTTSDSDDRRRLPRGAAGPADDREVLRWVETLYDPVQMSILTRLGIGAATHRELAADTGLTPETVRRELEELLLAKQVTRWSETHSGVPEGEERYVIDLRANWIEDAEVADLAPGIWNRAIMRLLRIMFREAIESLDAGTFDGRPDRWLLRFTFPLDNPSFQEARDIANRLCEEVVEEVERAASRLREDGEEPTAAVVNIVFFEYPPERWPSSPSGGEPRRRATRAGRAERLMALADPLRSRMIDTLMVTPAGLGDLADILGTTRSKVNYEIERLLADGVVRVVRRERRRGTAERIFAAVAPELRLADPVPEISEERTDEWSRWIVKRIFGEAIESIRFEGEVAMSQVTACRVPTALDARGFAAIDAAMDAAFIELAALRERCLSAVGFDRPPDHVAIFDLLLYELAPGAAAARAREGLTD